MLIEIRDDHDPESQTDTEDKHIVTQSRKHCDKQKTKDNEELYPSPSSLQGQMKKVNRAKPWPFHDD